MYEKEVDELYDMIEGLFKDEYMMAKNKKTKNEILAKAIYSCCSPQHPCDSPSFIVKGYWDTYLEFQKTYKAGVYIVWQITEKKTSYEGMISLSQMKYDRIQMLIR